MKKYTKDRDTYKYTVEYLQSKEHGVEYQLKENGKTEILNLVHKLICAWKILI